MKQAMEAPAPGRIPMMLPMIQLRRTVGVICLSSLFCQDDGIIKVSGPSPFDNGFFRKDESLG